MDNENKLSEFLLKNSVKKETNPSAVYNNWISSLSQEEKNGIDSRFCIKAHKIIKNQMELENEKIGREVEKYYGRK